MAAAEEQNVITLNDSKLTPEVIATLNVNDDERAILSALHIGLTSQLWRGYGYPSLQAVQEIGRKARLEESPKSHWGIEERVYYGIKHLRVLGFVDQGGLNEDATLEFARTGRVQKGGIYNLVELLENPNAGVTDFSKISRPRVTVLREIVEKYYAEIPNTNVDFVAESLQARLRETAANANGFTGY
jgi:hypothetical protein